VVDKGEEGKLITGHYTRMIEAEVNLGNGESGFENTRFLELATQSTPDNQFVEISNLVFDGHECTPRGDIHERITDAEKEVR
jgi:hypothetical protein